MSLCVSTGEPQVVEAMKTFAELTDQARLVKVSRLPQEESAVINIIIRSGAIVI